MGYRVGDLINIGVEDRAMVLSVKHIIGGTQAETEIEVVDWDEESAELVKRMLDLGIPINDAYVGKVIKGHTKGNQASPARRNLLRMGASWDY
jgi:hypothetical protein